MNAESLQCCHYTTQTSASADAVDGNLKIHSYCSSLCLNQPYLFFLTSISLKVCDGIKGEMIKGIKLKKDWFAICLTPVWRTGAGRMDLGDTWL